jgi:hypothetical protein
LLLHKEDQRVDRSSVILLSSSSFHCHFISPTCRFIHPQGSCL